MYDLYLVGEIIMATFILTLINGHPALLPMIRTEVILLTSLDVLSQYVVEGERTQILWLASMLSQ